MNSIIEIVERQSEIVQKQSRIIEELFNLLSQHIEAEDMNRLPVYAEMQNVTEEINELI